MTKRDIPFVISTIVDARKGRATLPAMAHAHHLASSSGLSGIAGELNEHIGTKSQPKASLFTWQGFMFGLAIGLTSNLIARKL